jgi:hypothetical protein
MTSPEINPADVVTKITDNIQDEFRAFLAALEADPEAPAYARQFIDGETAIVIDRDHIRILPYQAPPVEPEAPETGQYL